VTARAAVLDASAVVGLVLKQHGWGVVWTIVQSGAAVTTSPGLAEALITCRRKGYRGTREELVADLLELGLRIEPVIEDDAMEIAYLLERSDAMGGSHGKEANRLGSLSLGDAACLAVAHRLGAVAVVSDGTWEALGVEGLEILPFR
jgi:ribonuclease VapC